VRFSNLKLIDRNYEQAQKDLEAARKNACIGVSGDTWNNKG